MLSAMVLGLHGFIFALCGLAFYLISLRSFGVPYMLDAYLINDEDIKDTVIRVPWSFMNYRPQIIGKMRPARQHTLKNRKK
jgi:spore germination protein KA